MASSDPNMKRMMDLLKSDPKNTEAFKGLEKHYFFSQNWKQLYELYQFRSDSIKATDLNEYAKLCFKSGEIQEKHLGGRESALVCYKNAFTSYPRQLNYGDKLVEIYTLEQNWPQALDVLRRQLQVCEKEGNRLKILEGISSLYLEKMNNREEAKKFLLQILQMDEGHSKALFQLENLYKEDGDWKSLLRIYNLCLAKLEGEQKREILEQAAIICVEKLEDWSQAIHFNREILKVSSDKAKIYRTLEDLYKRTENWENCIKAITAQTGLLSDSESQAKKWLQISSLWRTKLNNVAQAIECAEKSWALSKNEATLQVLEEMHFQEENWKSLIKIYQRQCEGAKDQERKLELYCQMGKVANEKMGENALAIRCYQNALEEFPRNLEILNLLEPLLQKENRSDDLIRNYREELRLVSSDSEQIDIYNKIAEIYRAKEDITGAAKIYEEILQRFSGHQDSLENLRQIYTQLKNYPALVKTLERKIEINSQSPDLSTYLEIALLLDENLEKKEESIPYYEKILEINPKQMDVLEKLYLYYKDSQKAAELVDILERSIQIGWKTPVEGYGEIAKTYRDRLREPVLAIDAYTRVLEHERGNIPALKSLASLYQSQQLWDEYARIQLRRVEVSSSLGESIELHFSLVQVYEQENKRDLFEKHLLAIIRLDINNKESVESLKNFYQEQEDWEKYLHLLEKETLAAQWPVSSFFERYQELAQLYLEKLENLDNAIGCYEKAHHLIPEDEEVLETLESLYRKKEDYNKLVSILEQRATLCSEEAEACQYYNQVGTLYRDKLNEDGLAIDAFEKVIALDFSHEEALKSLLGLHQKREEYAKLIDVYLKKARFAPQLLNQTQEEAIYLEVASLWEEKLKNIPFAIFHYEKVLRLNRQQDKAIEQLLKLYRKEEYWLELAQTYRLKIALPSNSNEEKIKLSFDLAVIYRDHLKEPLQAIEVYQSILQLDENNLETIYALTDIYNKEEMHSPLLSVLDKKSRLVKEKEKKKIIFQEMAKISEERLLDFPQSISWHKKIIENYPEELDSWKKLRYLYYKLQSWGEIVQNIDKEVVLEKEVAKQIELLFEKADVCLEKLGDNSLAVSTYESILSLDPSVLKAYQSLAEIHDREKSYIALIKLYKRQTKVVPKKQQQTLILSCARIYEEKIKDEEKAKKALQAAFSLDKDFPAGRKMYIALLEQRQEWEELIAFLEEEVLLTQEKEKVIELLFQIGKIYEVCLDKREDALGVYKQLLEKNPHNLGAIQSQEKIFQREERFSDLFSAYEAELATSEVERERRIFLHLACAQLQRFELDDIDGAAKNYRAVLELELDPDNLVAVRGLEEIYEGQENYAALESMLFKELELQKNQQRLIEVHLRLAYLQEDKLGNVDVAVEHFAEAHLSRPNNLPILRRWKKLLRIQTQWKKYSEAVEKEIQLCSSPIDLVPLHQDIMEVYQEKLQDIPKAILHGEAIFELDDKHSPLQLENIRKLESLYEISGQRDKQAEMYLQETEVVKPEEDKDRLVYLYTESGKLYSSFLDNLSQAIYCYKKVLDLDNGNREALSALVKMYMGLQKWKELIELYEKTVKITGNRGEVELLHLKIAELWEKEFKNDPEALLHYQICYSMNRQNLDAISGLRRIFERQERWADAIEFLNVEVHLQEEKIQPALYLKMGELWEEKLEMPHQALICYLKVMGHGFHRATAERIMRIQEQVGEYQGLVEIIQKDLRVTEKNQDKVQKLLYLGSIYQDHLEDLDNAIDAYSKALMIKPDEMESLEALEVLFKKKKQWKKLVSVLNKKREHISDAGELRKLHCQIAQLYRERLYSGNMAITHYEHALEIAPHDLEIIQTLQELYQEWGYYKKLISMYLKEAQLTEDPEKIIALYEQMGETWEQRLFEDEQAVRSYERLLCLSPEHLGATRALAGLYKRYQSWDKLIPIYQVLIKDAQNHSNTKEEIEFSLHLGEVYQDEVNDFEAAIGVYKKILELEPAHSKALEETENLYKRLGRSQDMAALLNKKIELCQSNEDRLELYTHLGTLYEKELDNPDMAIEAFEYARSLQVDNPTVLKSLDWLYLRKKDWTKLAEVCQQEIKLSKDDSEKAQLYYRLGVIQRDRFRQIEESKKSFHQAVEFKADFCKALKALTGHAIREDNWTQAVKYIALEINYINDPDDKVQSLIELGTLYLSKLKLIQKAKEAFLLALEIDPKSIDALESMADIHFVQEEWDQAEPLFGRLHLLVDKEDKGRLSEIYYKGGYIAEKLGKNKDEAIIRYNNALKAKDDNLEALLAVGNIFFERAQWGFDKAQWQEALNIYLKILTHPKVEDKIDIIRRLALIYENLKVTEEAIAFHKKVLANYPEDIESINSLGKLHISKGEDQVALEYLQKVIKSEGSFIEKRNTLLILGEVQERLGDFDKAVESNLKAFSMGLENPSILETLGSLYSKLEKWTEAVEWLEKHYTCLKDADEKAVNRCLIADIQKKHLSQKQEAIVTYQQALADSPVHLDAIYGIAQIYEEKENWKILAETYQNFLSNLPGEKKVMALPVHLSLGQIYDEKLNQPKEAIEELNRVLKIDPKHAAARSRIARIKSEDSSLHSEAIEDYLLLLKKDAGRVSAYRALRKIFFEKKEMDLALRTCRALAFFDKLTVDEDKFMRQASPKKIIGLDTCNLSSYLCENDSAVYREVMFLTGEHMVKSYPADLELRYGIKKKDRLDPDKSHPINDHNKKIAELFGVVPFDIYLNPRKTHKFYVENTQPWSFIISEPLVEALNNEELFFLLSKYLFYVAQGQAFALKLDPTDLQSYFRVLRDWLSVGSSRAFNADALFKKIKAGIPRKVRKQLEERNDLWENMSFLDVNYYLEDLNRAANRSALLLTDSLDLSVQMAHRLDVLEQSGKLVRPEHTSRQDTLKKEASLDLLAFNLSDEYGKVRQKLGLA